MQERIKYTCKNCNWKDSVIAAWADIKPKRCMNRKCNTSFLKNPEQLLVEYPEALQVEMQTKTEKKIKNGRKQQQ